MTDVDVESAGEDLSSLVDRAMAGDEVLISKGGVPVVKIVRLGEELLPRRQLGMLEGRMTIPPDFDDPLPDEMLDAFEGRT